MYWRSGIINADLKTDCLCRIAGNAMPKAMYPRPLVEAMSNG